MKLSQEIAMRFKQLIREGRDAILDDCRRLGVKGQRSSHTHCLLANWCRANGASYASFRDNGFTIFGEKGDFSDIVDAIRLPKVVEEIMNSFDSGYLEAFEQPT